MSRPPAFRQIAAPLDVDDEALGRVADQMGVPKLVKPSPPPLPEGRQPLQNAPIDAAAAPSAPEVQIAPRVKKRTAASIVKCAALEKLTLEVPGYLIDAIKRDALDQRSTARHVVMLALQKAGFKIDETDMMPDGRRHSAKPGSL
jgi:hypothetical protein